MINFIVVSKGAGRIAEVAARFTLEALLANRSRLIANSLLAESLKKMPKKPVKTLPKRPSFMEPWMEPQNLSGGRHCRVDHTGVNIIGGLSIGIGVKECLGSNASNSTLNLRLEMGS